MTNDLSLIQTPLDMEEPVQGIAEELNRTMQGMSYLEAGPSYRAYLEDFIAGFVYFQSLKGEKLEEIQIDQVARRLCEISRSISFSVGPSGYPKPHIKPLTRLFKCVADYLETFEKDRKLGISGTIANIASRVGDLH